jgi:tungstate transport system permease protein
VAPSFWGQFDQAISLIVHGNGYPWSAAWVSVRLALVATVAALIIGLPFGLALGLGRFRGRRALQILANASIGLPPVLVGLVLLLLLLPTAPLASLHIAFTLKAMYIAQTVLALPYIVALVPAAIQGMPEGLLDQARRLGAGRAQLAVLALREARVGVMAAVIAAAASAVSEVGAVILVGGNTEDHTETLVGGLLEQLDPNGASANFLAMAILLAVVIVVLVGLLAIVQQLGPGLRLPVPRWVRTRGA